MNQINSEDDSLSKYANLYQIVLNIPYAKVATYKQLAILTGNMTARQVGYAMSKSPKRFQGKYVPWHRVVNSQGKVSVRNYGEPDPLQLILLQDEGVLISTNGKINFDLHLWESGLN